MNRHDIRTIKLHGRRRTMTTGRSGVSHEGWFASISIRQLVRLHESFSRRQHRIVLGPKDRLSPYMNIIRSFTPRTFDPQAGTLSIDFGLPEKGLATEWAVTAATGTHVQLAGLRASVVVPHDFDRYLPLGDESTLPSLNRRLEGLRSSVPVTAISVVSSADDIQQALTQANVTRKWEVRHDAAGRGDAILLRSALERLPFLRGDGFVWVAAETSAAKTLFQYLINKREQSPAWVRAAGYRTQVESNAMSSPARVVQEVFEQQCC